MPDLPREPERPYCAVASSDRPQQRRVVRGYAELHCKTNFSFLEGASHPDELVHRAAELRHAAIAITDRNSLAGVVRAHVAAKELQIKLLVGTEVCPTDGPPLLLLAMDREGYGRLSRLLTVGCRRTTKGNCELSLRDVLDHGEGLLALVVPPQEPTAATLVEVQRQLERVRAGFGNRAYLIAERNLDAGDDAKLAWIAALGRQAHVPIVAANDVHYHVPGRRYLHDVLAATRHRCTVAELGSRMFRNAERHLKTDAEMREMFHAVPGAVERTLEVAGRCHFSLDELKYDYPEELCPRGLTPVKHLRQLTEKGVRLRYPDGVPFKVRELIEHELALISEMNYEAYFLTVWDLVRFARERGILCQGRGSAANSAVCYCLGVTSVDPEQIDLLFERFISKERGEAPDIDIDFEHERREEVIQYVYQKYGRERAGMTAEVITYRPRSAVRDIGKALGLSLDQVGRLAGVLEHYNQKDETLPGRFREAGIDPDSRVAKLMRTLLSDLLGFPRHLSQHVGGLVISHRPLCELVPIENAAMADRTVIQWDKNDLDALGILKVDCLALGMLTAIRKAFGLIHSSYGQEFDLATVPKEDPVVYDMMQRADTMGVFQIESRAQMAMLPRLKPKEFYDLVIEVALVRPGPIQGDMVHPYLRRRCGLEEIDYPSDEVRDTLRKTLGVPLFQEQAMKLAIVAAGFTPGEADQLRRAMGAWRRTGVMEKFRAKLIDGMLARNYSQQFAENLFHQIEGFGSYGFPESHAASFALLVYVSCWIKRYYPEVFLAALLNSQPMGFYAPAQLVANARQHGAEVRPVDVSCSDWDCTLEPVAGKDTSAVRLGLRMIGGLPESAARRIAEVRRRGPFASMAEFTRRTGLGQPVTTKLARADAFQSLELDRRRSLWQALEQPESGPLDDRPDDRSSMAKLQPMRPWDHVLADYRTSGLSLRGHPLKFLRNELQKLRVVRSADLIFWPEDRTCRVAGLVLLRQRPGTASGITFVTLEDETGLINLIVHPGVWERFHQAARTSRLMLVRGKVQREEQVIHVIAEKIEDLTDWIASTLPQSRDFR